MGTRLLPPLALLFLLAGPQTPESHGHGGYPLRLAVRESPELSLLGHVVLTYLREGQGMTVDPVFLGDSAELRREYAAGKIDLFLDASPGGECPEISGGAAHAEHAGRWFDEAFPGAWTGLFTFPAGPSPCALPALVAHEKVVKDLRFSLLREALERLVSSVTADDVAAVRELSDGSARSTVTAARKVLGRKGLL